MSYILDALRQSRASADEQTPPSNQRTMTLVARLPWQPVLLLALLVLAALAWSVWQLGNGSAASAVESDETAVESDEIESSSNSDHQSVVHEADNSARELRPEVVRHIAIEDIQAPVAGFDRQSVADMVPAEPAAAAGIALDASESDGIADDATSSVATMDAEANATVASTTPSTTAATQESATDSVELDGEPDVAMEASSEPSPEPIVEVRQLPPLSALRSIPTLSINSHVYSDDPDRRSITVNGRMLREGDRINQTIRLDAVTPEGALLNVDGYPLNINRRRGWQAIE